jgi:hypothetical protein
MEVIKIIEEMSKDGVNWELFSEHYKPEGAIIILDEQYHLQKLEMIRRGYVYWRTTIKSI